MTTTDLVLRTTTDLYAQPDATTDTTPTLPAGLVPSVGNLVGYDCTGFFAAIADALDEVGLGEQEIAAAQTRHPQQADRIWHSFSLLPPQPGLEHIDSELVYRAHCREILDRVAAGADTRPGTTAEVWCSLRSTSLVSPLTSAATGLYMRMYQAAGLPTFDELTESSRHHEALERSTIDAHEQLARRKLAVSSRRLGAIGCRGLHNSDKVDCIYAPAIQLTIEA